MELPAFRLNVALAKANRGNSLESDQSWVEITTRAKACLKRPYFYGWVAPLERWTRAGSGVGAVEKAERSSVSSWCWCGFFWSRRSGSGRGPQGVHFRSGMALVCVQSARGSGGLSAGALKSAYSTWIREAKRGKTACAIFVQKEESCQLQSKTRSTY